MPFSSEGVSVIMLDLSMDMLPVGMMVLDQGKRVSEMVDEDKGPCGGSRSTKQATHAPRTKVLNMPTDESGVDASQWQKVFGLRLMIGRSFTRQVVVAYVHCAKCIIFLQPDTLLPICIEEKVDWAQVESAQMRCELQEMPMRYPTRKAQRRLAGEAL